MKSFDEWFEEKRKTSNFCGLEGAVKAFAFDAWQAAQEVQRESDADICAKLEDGCVDTSSGYIMSEDYNHAYTEIKNNKAV